MLEFRLSLSYIDREEFIMKTLRMSAIPRKTKPKKNKRSLPKSNSSAGKGMKKQSARKDTSITVQGNVEKSTIINGDGNIIGSQNQATIIKDK
jgi:hypothetical protein